MCDVAILLRTAQEPEQKTFVPVPVGRQERVEVEQQVGRVEVDRLLLVWSPVAQARKHRLVW